MSSSPAEDLWAQCDSETCKKWRKLPPGNAVDDNAPWFCWMNPDSAKNACAISEESYDMDGWADELDTAASSKAAKKGKKSGGKKKGDAQKKRKRDDAGEPSRPKSRRASVNELIQQGRGKVDTNRQSITRSKVVGELKKRGQKFVKMLNRERMSSKDADVNSMNPQHWKNLCVHAPEAAHLACEAANWASAAKYFKKNGHDGKQLFDLSQSLNQIATRFATAISSRHIAELLLEAGETPPQEKTGVDGGASGRKVAS
ncbi:hypothetical protein BSKO_04640 [Bryopsis sp. KO-2023]|nr:hypothetical protein BSKO_04640 [Bryopsis sp. KO-2023]